jgi:Tol biopolymer transport system component
MYFAANVGGHSHLWRQQVSSGLPEQITFGTTDEEGIAVSPDGRSLVTSVGRRVSAVWLHESARDRPLTSEGYASDPRWSADGTIVFYRDSGTATASNLSGPSPAGELRALDVKTGQTTTILPNVLVTDYDVSPNAREVVYTTRERGDSQLWIAPTDRSASPRVLTRSADQPSFAGSQTIVFRDTSTRTNFLTRINVDGSGRARVLGSPIVEKGGASPDGRMVAAVVPLAKDDTRLAHPLAVPYDTMAIPVGGGSMTKLCNGSCPVSWSLDGRFLYVSRGRTVVLPIAAGRSLPDMPASGVSVGDDNSALPRAQVLAEYRVTSRSDPSSYLFTRAELRANLFRIPLH